jgi:hypothetical protein
MGGLRSSTGCEALTSIGYLRLLPDDERSGSYSGPEVRFADITTDLPDCRFGARHRLEEKRPESWFPALPSIRGLGESLNLPSPIGLRA